MKSVVKPILQQWIYFLTNLILSNICIPQSLPKGEKIHQSWNQSRLHTKEGENFEPQMETGTHLDSTLNFDCVSVLWNAGIVNINCFSSFYEAHASWSSINKRKSWDIANLPPENDLFPPIWTCTAAKHHLSQSSRDEASIRELLVSQCMH